MGTSSPAHFLEIVLLIYFHLSFVLLRLVALIEGNLPPTFIEYKKYFLLNSLKIFSLRLMNIHDSTRSESVDDRRSLEGFVNE